VFCFSGREYVECTNIHEFINVVHEDLTAANDELIYASKGMGSKIKIKKLVQKNHKVNYQYK